MGLRVTDFKYFRKIIPKVFYPILSWKKTR